MSINITVNGTAMKLPDGYTLYDLIEQKKWKLVPMRIRIDGEEVPSPTYCQTKLSEGQIIKVIPQFGGG